VAMIKLQNQFLRVEISPEGAELHSVFSLTDNIEYLWQADKKYWARHAPHLFPIVGRLKDDTMEFNGAKFKMPRHGFARDRQFVIVSEEQDTAEFELCADNDSLKIYPFHFSLRINYSLHENHLITTYKIFNPSNGDLFYSIGAHPGFALNIGGVREMKNYFLEFEKEEDTKRFFVEDGLISEQTTEFQTQNKIFQLAKELFDEDAIVLKKINSSFVQLLNSRNGHGVKLQWGKEFSFFGIWSAKDCDEFICLEPWAGIADAENFEGSFDRKEGMRKLGAGESEELELQFTFF
jgi:galactose mutarotase-like enzyme